MTSNFLDLNKNDLLKGLLMAIIGGALFTLQQAFNDCGIACISWVTMLNASLASGVAYLIKNYFTDHNGKLGGKF